MSTSNLMSAEQRFRGGIDRISDYAMYGAVFGTALLIVAYLYEVVARYFFAAPTTWANEVVAYSLCISVFLAFPKVTQQGGHVAIDLLVRSLDGEKRRRLERSLLLISAATCILVAAVAGVVSYRQFVAGTLTMGVHAFPKWSITIFVTFGFVLSGLQFLAQAIGSAAGVRSSEPGATGEY